MTKKNIMPTLVLGAICLIVAALLALVNMITAPVIEKAQSDKANAALLEVLPDGEGFEAITLSDYALPSTVTNAYKEEGGGYVIQLSVTGKNAGMVIMCGIDKDGKITGTKCISNQETPGYAAPVFEKTEDEQYYKGMDSETLEEYLVAGSTLTSKAYAGAVKDALNAFIILCGGSVDLRTPEQILQDNCNAALGTEGVIFKPWFKTAAIDGVEEIYVAEGAEGSVLLVGETFVGIGAEGTIVTEGIDDATRQTALSAYTVYSGETLTDLTLPEGADSLVVSAKQSAGGAYIIEVKGAGYGINGESSKWHPISGEYILIRVSIGSDGKIIDCETVSEAETDGVGDKCASDEYENSYVGKDESTYEGAGAELMTGATVTHTGYQTAIKAALELITLLRGGE